jgi:hypothetical protein
MCKSQGVKSVLHRICPACKRSLLPALARPSWHKHVLRAAAAGMVSKPDPRAEKIKRRKDRRSRTNMTRDSLANAVKLIIRGNLQPAAADPDDQECADCLALNQMVA